MVVYVAAAAILAVLVWRLWPRWELESILDSGDFIEKDYRYGWRRVTIVEHGQPDGIPDVVDVKRYTRKGFRRSKYGKTSTAEIQLRQRRYSDAARRSRRLEDDQGASATGIWLKRLREGGHRPEDWYKFRRAGVLDRVEADGEEVSFRQGGVVGEDFEGGPRGG